MALKGEELIGLSGDAKVGAGAFPFAEVGASGEIHRSPLARRQDVQSQVTLCNSTIVTVSLRSGMTLCCVRGRDKTFSLFQSVRWHLGHATGNLPMVRRFHGCSFPWPQRLQIRKASIRPYRFLPRGHESPCIQGNNTGAKSYGRQIPSPARPLAE